MPRNAQRPAPEREAGHQDQTAVAAAERCRRKLYWLAAAWWVAGFWTGLALAVAR
jgi:hypothetical protein